MPQTIKGLPAMWETCVQSLCWEDPLEKEMATHSSILAWRIPWTWDRKELDTTERLHFHFHFAWPEQDHAHTSLKDGSQAESRTLRSLDFVPNRSH